MRKRFILFIALFGWAQIALGQHFFQQGCGVNYGTDTPNGIFTSSTSDDQCSGATVTPQAEIVLPYSWRLTDQKTFFARNDPSVAGLVSANSSTITISAVVNVVRFNGMPKRAKRVAYQESLVLASATRVNIGEVLYDQVTSLSSQNSHPASLSDEGTKICRPFVVPRSAFESGLAGSHLVGCEIRHNIPEEVIGLLVLQPARRSINSSDFLTQFNNEAAPITGDARKRNYA